MAIASFSDAEVAKESTEVLEYQEEDPPAAAASGQRGQPDQAGKPRAKVGPRKKRKKTRKKTSGSGSLALALALGLGVVVLGGMVIGLLYIRGLAEGEGALTADATLRESVSENAQDTEEEAVLADASDPQGDTGETDNVDPDEFAAADGTGETETAAAASSSSPGEAPGETGTAPSTGRAKTNEATASTPTKRSNGASGRAGSKSPDAASKKSLPPATNGSVADANEPAPEAVLTLQEQASAGSVGVGRRVPFSVGILNPPAERKLSVVLRMQCPSDEARWRRYSMKRTSRTLWEKRINFDIEDRGTCKYYFSAQAEGDASASSLGSRSQPFKVKVR